MTEPVADADSAGREEYGWKLPLLLAVLVMGSSALRLYEAGTVSWPWLAVGAASWGLATGPVAASRFGRRVGAWFRSIGVVGRAVTIVAFAIAVWAVKSTFDPATASVDSLVAGGMGGVILSMFRKVTASN